MLNQVRKFISDRSPDWLNVEVNQDFFNNFSQALTDTSSVSPEAEEETSETIHPSSLIPHPFKGKPHWRRIKQVFETLEEAGTGTYTELVNYVREVTGIGCSRKLISKWKRQRHLCFASSQNDQRAEVPAFSFVLESNIQEESEPRQEPSPSASLIISEDCQSQEPSPDYSPSPPVSQSPLRGRQKAKVKRQKGLSPTFALCPLPFDLRAKRVVSPSSRQAWPYVAATAIVVGLVGFDWLNPQSQSGDNSVRIAVAQEAASPSSPVPPKPNARRSEPRNIKISLTLGYRQDTCKLRHDVKFCNKYYVYTSCIHVYTR